MDIDTEPLVDTNSYFSVVFPLPYRCLFLVGIGILGWATNLHGLYFLGIDTGYALDIRRYNDTISQSRIPLGVSNGHLNDRSTPFAHPSTLYRPLYKILVSYGAITAISWLFFRQATAGFTSLTDSSKYIPSLTFVIIVMLLISPWSLFQRHERFTFLRATLRCIAPSISQTIYFSDVVLADIFTSFAKVFGDFWLAARILMSAGHLWKLPAENGMIIWVTPLLMSLPYAIRLRQCVSEYFTTGSTRSLFNAAKYATAFPVILLSAAQRSVSESSATTKHGDHWVFQIWVVSVFVNSVYSFWWDVTNDWGLSMLKFSTPFSSRKRPSTPAEPTPWGTQKSTDLDTPSAYFGLRSQLIFNDPMIYYVAIFINFILRFTWSLKLSSHLHYVADLEAGVFMIEALEVIRRWIWVFIRVEWEVLKLSREAATSEEYEFLMREGGETDASDM